MTIITNTAAALSQLLNATLGGRCNETTSSRLGRLRGHQRWATVGACIVNVLFMWEVDHVGNAVKVNKRRMVRTLREMQGL